MLGWRTRRQDFVSTDFAQLRVLEIEAWPGSGCYLYRKLPNVSTAAQNDDPFIFLLGFVAIIRKLEPCSTKET